ncbi:hypothetical protein V6N11_046215, partial [Hibiscus sabdariffa]
IFTFFV